MSLKVSDGERKLQQGILNILTVQWPEKKEKYITS